jgi:hypothetical protein
MPETDLERLRRGAAVPWILNPSERPVVEAIERELSIHSDRGMAVIAVGLIDKLLMDAIKSRLRYKTSPSKAKKDLFDVNMPLASTQSKINLGVMLGLYIDEVFNDLKAVNTIRNKFAHKLECNDFSSPLVAPFCESLWIPDHLFIVVSHSPSPIEFGGQGNTSHTDATQQIKRSLQQPRRQRNLACAFF